MDSKYKQPKTLQAAIVHFSDPDNALAYMVRLRWPDGVITCPSCGRTDVVFLQNQRKWQCKSVHPKRQFSAKVNTVFEDSPIPLDKWLVAVWMLSNCKNGVSSYEIAKAIGVTQKSAWFMMHRIRVGMQDKKGFGAPTKLGGPENEVEVDETFIGGKKRNMHADRALRYEQKGGAQGKTIVQGILDRDKLHWRFVHEVVNKTESYVRGRVHVNGMENFWSLLKRGLNGTYVAVEPFHLFRYVDEQVFRYDNRDMNDAQRFELALSQITGKRLTYAELTGKTGDATPF